VKTQTRLVNVVEETEIRNGMSNIKSDSAASYMYPTFTSSIITGENAADAVKQERCADTTLLMRRRDQKLRSWLSEIESLLPAAQYAGLS